MQSKSELRHCWYVNFYCVCVWWCERARLKCTDLLVFAKLIKVVEANDFNELKMLCIAYLHTFIHTYLTHVPNVFGFFFTFCAIFRKFARSHFYVFYMYAELFYCIWFLYIWYTLLSFAMFSHWKFTAYKCVCY